MIQYIPTIMPFFIFLIFTPSIGINPPHQIRFICIRELHGLAICYRKYPFCSSSAVHRSYAHCADQQGTHHLSNCIHSIFAFQFCGAKLLKIFGIYKDLTVKIKFIYIFSGKCLLFARLCDCNLGGTLLLSREDRHYYKYFKYTSICTKKSAEALFFLGERHYSACGAGSGDGIGAGPSGRGP